MVTEVYRQRQSQLYANTFRVIRYNVCFGRNFEECRSTRVYSYVETRAGDLSHDGHAPKSKEDLAWLLAENEKS